MGVDSKTEEMRRWHSEGEDVGGGEGRYDRDCARRKETRLRGGTRVQARSGQLAGYHTLDCERKVEENCGKHVDGT